MIRRVALLGLALLGVTRQLAARQDPPAIHAGKRIDGTLGAGDPFFPVPKPSTAATSSGPSASDSLRIKAYRFDASKGRQYRIVLSSDAFDATLMLARPVGGLTRVVQMDHHPRGGTVSRLMFRAPDSGEFFLIVGAPGGTGTFSLAIDEVAAVVPKVGTIAVGQAVNGAVSEKDPLSDETATHYTSYDIHARSGQRLHLELSVKGFDGWLNFGRVAASGQWAVIAQADTGGMDAPEGFSVVTPEDGTYRIRILGVGTIDTGSFVLRVNEAAAPRATPETRPIAANVDAKGDLEEDAATDTAGYRYQHWIFRAPARSRIRIDLLSKAFDAYLKVGRMRTGRFVASDSNDDVAKDTTDSRVIFTATDSGEYVIRVQSARRSAQSGEYVLRLEQRPPARAVPETGRIVVGQQVTSRLDDNDASLVDGSPYEHWKFSADSGARFVITMRSKDFDAFLMIGQMEQGSFVEFARDDDGGGGSDARIVMTAPRTGEYVVRTNTFGPLQKGEYTLTLERSGPTASP
jgi:hypothetical protein